MKLSPPSSTYLLTQMIFSLGRSSSGNHLTSHSLPGTDQHFWCDLAGKNQAPLPWPKGHSLSQGFFAGGPDIFRSLRLRNQRCSGWSFKKWDMWGLFCYTNVSKKGNPRGLVWRCTLMKSEPQFFLKNCPKLSLGRGGGGVWFFFIFGFEFSCACLMSKLVHFC